MKLRGNEMTIQRGETFSIDRTIVNRDGSPFIVSSEYDNPYLLITVSSTRYDVEKRYRVNWWLDLKDLPRFQYTRPKRIPSFDVISVIDDEPGEYLYYVDDVTKCKYFDEDNEWHDYEFRVVHHFQNHITRDWVEQSYVYSIQLVSGMNTLEYLEELYKRVIDDTIKGGSLSLEELYLEIKNFDETLVKDLDISKPITTFDTVQIILEPTKLTVMSDLNGGL
jgi:hypothetical protein